MSATENTERIEMMELLAEDEPSSVRKPTNFFFRQSDYKLLFGRMFRDVDPACCHNQRGDNGALLL